MLRFPFGDKALLKRAGVLRPHNGSVRNIATHHGCCGKDFAFLLIVLEWLKSKST